VTTFGVSRLPADLSRLLAYLQRNCAAGRALIPASSAGAGR
jgi:hypothetical protein